MKRNRILVIILSMIVALSVVFCTAGCGEKNEKADDTSDVATTESTADSTDADDGAKKEVGEGKTSFDFVVVDSEGNETAFTVKTDKATVGEALTDVGLIEGEEGEYGLYVTTVNGITADYDTDGVYWAFYINGEYAMTGVDSTDVTDGATYMFKIEK